VIAVVACLWGVFAGLALLGLAERAAATRRARTMRRRSRRRTRTRRRRVPAFVARYVRRLPAGMVARVAGAPRRRRRARREDEALIAELPVAVDLIGVAVGAGCNPFRAVAIAVRWCPRRVAAALTGIERNVALGNSFDRALRDAGDGTPSLRGLTEALRTSARLGSPMVAVLAQLAQEVRADVRRRAEARARTVPVRLLFPLVFCILPAFALLTVVPVLLEGISL
jgi:pilus assembly protein TadC